MQIEALALGAETLGQAGLRVVLNREPALTYGIGAGLAGLTFFVLPIDVKTGMLSLVTNIGASRVVGEAIKEKVL
ncbi:hypothetical protein [Streptomyces sp. 5-10]|uniref:hypothetical protein n=1 Tax=Streptomyces sp. 5-10 TaxID=878925 RepID=UPI00168BDA6A|nr:hypothetical protein [Streptomyces sp. 5-10]MBD3004832.1 hypothetical protein [Streptomyces sp. 5-10]